MASLGRIQQTIEIVVALVRDHDHRSAAGLHFLDVPDHLFEDGIVRGDRHHRHQLVDERNRSVLHLAGRVAFGVDVRNFFQLQRALERDRVVNTPSQIQEVAACVEPGGHLLDGRSCLQRLLEQQRQVRERRKMLGGGLGSQRAADLGQVQREQVERDELAGEGLGRGDADLRAGVRVDRPVGFAGGHAADDVADGDAARALALGFPEGGERVGGLARLGDHDSERVVVDDRVAVAVLGCRSPLRPAAGRSLRSGTCRPARHASWCRTPG